MLSGGENAAFYEAEMKTFNGESGWKASFCPNQLEEGKPLEDLCVGIIYKARSTLNIFKCLYIV